MYVKLGVATWNYLQINIVIDAIISVPQAGSLNIMASVNATQ